MNHEHSQAESQPEKPADDPRRVSLPVLASSHTDLATLLRQHVRGEIRFGQHDRMLYATDASLYQVEPLGVVIPDSIEDAAHAFELCMQQRVPVLPRGGGTSLAGQCTNRAVVIDTSRACRAVREIDTVRGCCSVEPGITIDELNSTLTRYHEEHSSLTHWFFSPDPATSRHACIGGCIGNNAAGARSIRYGRTSEHVLAIDALLADGSRVRLQAGAGRQDKRAGMLAMGVASIVRSCEASIRARFARTVRRNAGYGLDMILAQLDADIEPIDLDLTPLLCGSEGTLAFTLGATLSLDPVPAKRMLAVIAFESLDKAIAAVKPILAAGDPNAKVTPTAVELLDDMVLNLARENKDYRPLVEMLTGSENDQGKAPAAVLYVEFSQVDQLHANNAVEHPDGDTGFAAAIARLEQVVAPCAVRVFDSTSSMTNAWKLRKAGEPLLHGIAGSRKPLTFVEDNAVPVEHLSEFVRRFRKIVSRHGTTAAFFAHASVGVLHIRPLLDLHNVSDRKIMQQISLEAADLARELGGVMSGEHGDGKVRSPLLERYFGPEIIEAFRQIKTLFDPKNLLNPGNIVAPVGFERVDRDISTITTRTRIMPKATPSQPIPALAGVRPFFDYSDQHSLAGAIEMCNGAGVCRKKRLPGGANGTMCPSYHATLDERHSTRGRGNALRLAISGQFGAKNTPDWNDPETMQTLDLCLSCKACKRECPSNVDIARLKAEYLAQSYAAAGHEPFRALFFGSVRRINQLGSRFPRLNNAVGASALGRFFSTYLLGIAPQRTLPLFSESLPKILKKQMQHTTGKTSNTQDTASNGLIDRVVSTPADLVPGMPAVVIFGDCFSMYNEPEIGFAAVRVLQAFGYQVGLADVGCCGRAMISTGLLARARSEISRTASGLQSWLSMPQVQGLVVLEPSCLSAILDDWQSLFVPGVSRSALAKIAAKASTLEAFLDNHWDAHPTHPHPLPYNDGKKTSPQIDTVHTPIYHGHCHQKALGEVADDLAIFNRLGLLVPTVLDTGCCGMAGSFGYSHKKHALSMEIAEQSLLPQLRAQIGTGENGNTSVLAPGTSCRAQIVHCMPQEQPVHPVSYLAQVLGLS